MYQQLIKRDPTVDNTQVNHFLKRMGLLFCRLSYSSTNPKEQKNKCINFPICTHLFNKEYITGLNLMNVRLQMR